MFSFTFFITEIYDIRPSLVLGKLFFEKNGIKSRLAIKIFSNLDIT